ncbi:MAG: hypothetical protein F6K47_38145 [Symploca sp. SIO2E6]|nr:hypothetical protein [Symploca sp. SIO2E6]
MKRDAGTQGRGDAERGIFMHGGEIFFMRTASCLAASCLLPSSLSVTTIKKKIWNRG